jgi:hypothetical protein
VARSVNNGKILSIGELPDGEILGAPTGERHGLGLPFRGLGPVDEGLNDGTRTLAR